MGTRLTPHPKPSTSGFSRPSEVERRIEAAWVLTLAAIEHARHTSKTTTGTTATNRRPSP